MTGVGAVHDDGVGSVENVTICKIGEGGEWTANYFSAVFMLAWRAELTAYSTDPFKL